MLSCVVELQGLQKEELNGKRGVCLGQTDEQRQTGRIGVRVDGVQDVSVKLQHVRNLVNIENRGPKGFGVIAQERLKAGCLLVRERPALHAQVGSTVDKQQWKKLSKVEQDAVMDLSDAYADANDGKTLEGIIATNALPCAPNSEHSVLCTLASRFNHGCSPNAEYLWIESSQMEEVWAVRDIAPGEEVCVNYIGDDVCQPRAFRQARLRGGFRFDCCCVTCLSACPKSDERRERLVKLHEEILSYRDRPEEGIRIAENRLELLSTEGIGAPRTAAQVCNDGFELALLMGDREEIQAWAHMSYEAHRLGWGAEHALTKQMHHYAQYPPVLEEQPKRPEAKPTKKPVQSTDAADKHLATLPQQATAWLTSMD